MHWVETHSLSSPLPLMTRRETALAGTPPIFQLHPPHQPLQPSPPSMAENYQKKELLALMGTGANKREQRHGHSSSFPASFTKLCKESAEMADGRLGWRSWARPPAKCWAKSSNLRTASAPQPPRYRCWSGAAFCKLPTNAYAYCPSFRCNLKHTDSREPMLIPCMQCVSTAARLPHSGLPSRMVPLSASSAPASTEVSQTSIVPIGPMQMMSAPPQHS